MEPMDSAAWRHLEQVEAGNVLLDSRSLIDRVQIPAFIRLYQAGYCTLMETGPGESIHIFSITETGKAALEARRGNRP